MTSGTFKYAARDLTRWVFPEPEGPISRMLLFSTTTSRRSGSATMGSGASRSQVSTRRLKWLLTPRARRLLATACPITYWSRWATRVLGAGIDAKRASFEGRSGGGAGSGSGWGVVWATACEAQKPQMRVGGSKPPSKSGTLELKQKSQEGGWSDMGHQGRRHVETTHDGCSIASLDGVSCRLRQLDEPVLPAQPHQDLVEQLLRGSRIVAISNRSRRQPEEVGLVATVLPVCLDVSG